VVVNYTYELFNNKSLSTYERLLFVYSVLKCQSYGYKVKIHGCEEFLNLCKELLTDVELHPIVKKTAINTNVFWAYQKILTYQKMNVGEIHLDIDAVLKEPFDNIENIDIHTAYQDNPELAFQSYYFNNIPDFVKFGNPDGFNMSFVCFNNETLKDLYVNTALEMMDGVTPKERVKWQHMVFVEQAMLKQMCEFYNYSYKYLSSSYYHLGYAKKYLGKQSLRLRCEIIEKKLINFLTEKQIQKIKNV